jgi:hypothetical protein
MLHYGRMHSYSFFTDPRFLLGVAVIVAVLRANRDDLPDLFRALMGWGATMTAGRFRRHCPSPTMTMDPLRRHCPSREPAQTCGNPRARSQRLAALLPRSGVALPACDQAQAGVYRPARYRPRSRS